MGSVRVTYPALSPPLLRTREREGGAFLLGELRARQGLGVQGFRVSGFGVEGFRVWVLGVLGLGFRGFVV